MTAHGLPSDDRTASNVRGLARSVQRLCVRLGIRLWLLWLLCFYSVWGVLLWLNDQWSVVAEHWGIAVAMAFGSYTAGATPMGGGTVGFPILVLLFDEPATLGRDFSFAVQSIGMTSASIFIISRRQPLEWQMLRYALLGSIIGTPLGVMYVAPHVPSLVIKITFAVIWASFGVLHMYRLKQFVRYEGLAAGAHRFDRNAGFLVGLLAGLTVASITGVGIDMVLYAVLVLLCQADLKIAIPTSVVIMAATSIFGIATKNLVTGVRPGVYENWLAAAPVVALGAPLGSMIVARIGRAPTLWFVSVLCIAQFFWTIRDEWESLGRAGVALAIGAVVLANVGFEWLYRIGARLDRRSSRPVSVPALEGAAVAPEG